MLHYERETVLYISLFRCLQKVEGPFGLFFVCILLIVVICEQPLSLPGPHSIEPSHGPYMATMI